VLPGKGSVIGDALARHPKVRKISFTGGTTTGRHLAHVAAEKLIPASLELGGKSPTIVLEDADIEQAARGICYGIFSSGGQACIAGSRLFVHEKVYPQLMARLLELTRGLRVGHPFSDDTHVGPLINESTVRACWRTSNWRNAKAGGCCAAARSRRIRRWRRAATSSRRSSKG
jgi:betaine-aldehyde dehydrogenase